MRLDRLQFLGNRSLEQAPAVPARDQMELVTSKERLQQCGIAREFVAELDALKARPARLGQARVEPDIAAQFRQIVVAPADWADAEADGHDRALPCFLRGRA